MQSTDGFLESDAHKFLASTASALQDLLRIAEQVEAAVLEAIVEEHAVKSGPSLQNLDLLIQGIAVLEDVIRRASDMELTTAQFEKLAATIQLRSLRAHFAIGLPEIENPQTAGQYVGF